MTRATHVPLGAVPDAVRPAWAAARDALGVEPEVLRPGSGKLSWVATTSAHVVYLAWDERGRARVRREARRLRWAAEAGIPVPPLVDGDARGSWIAVRRVRDDPPVGAVYVEAALAAASSVAGAAPPPAAVLQGTRTRRAPTASRPIRMFRMWSAGMDLREFASARAAAGALPHDTLAHGDFHLANVLFDALAGCVHLVDLEYLSYAPKGTDALMLWAGLDRREDREAVVEALLRPPEADRVRLAVLHRWLALRVLADLVIAPPHEREPHRIVEAFALVDEARENARRWGV